VKYQIEVARDEIFICRGGRGVRVSSACCLISARRVGSHGGRHGGEGGSDIDPHRLHVEKPTRLEMTFLFFVVPELC